MDQAFLDPEFSVHRWWTLGFWNLGPTHIPPIPPVAGMTDRAGTGEVWYLFWDGESHLALSSILPPACQDVYVFQPWDGPYLGAQGWRLGVTTAYPGSGLLPAGTPHLVVDVPGNFGQNFYTTAWRPLTCPDITAPLLWQVPESTGWPAPQPGVIPGIPSTAPVPTGGGLTEFYKAFATNIPVLVSSTYVTPSAHVPQPWHLTHGNPAT